VRRLWIIAALALLAPGCGPEDLTLLSDAELPEDVYGPPAPSPSPETIPADGRVFFVQKRRLEPATARLQPVLASVEEALLVALFQGPRSDQLATEIPDGSRLNGVEVVGGIATVDVSGDFERAAPPRSQALRIAQVVYTLTVPMTGITSVRFQIDGVDQEAIGGAQLGTIPGPVDREDYVDFAPSREQA
jgi:hypothetical protein